MAGMLPGVEAARRRRFHITNNGAHQSPAATSSRRSSFCLHAISHNPHSNSPQPKIRNPTVRQLGNETMMRDDESRLGDAAREAKKRLDERFQPKQRSHKNNSTFSSLELPNNLKRSGLILMKRRSWLRVRWKSCEEGECPVCLEQLGVGSFMQLPCAHRFHTKCLVPCIMANALCPCCRTEIHPSNN
ncbi:RING/U-box superfamily protein [Striga hermonthica]|uniref:RING-type E3 ubiquitin transferase n=1 Tax=Striga hermonthica TaxID=68872 RepID=A0A9N7NJV7_STRHE|nr:RING/U-box superfamily protein [Striga hermonthica]